MEDKLLVRFVEYNFKNEEDECIDPIYITALYVKSYDRFIELIKSMRGEEIYLKEIPYTIDSYKLGYKGGEDDALYLNVYCIKTY